jgi:hypothetical protein
MLETLASIITIVTFFVYIFIEWPKIRERWQNSYHTAKKILLIVVIPFGLLGFGSLLLGFSTGSNLFMGVGFTSLGISMLIPHRLSNDIIAYKSRPFPGFISYFFGILVWCMTLLGVTSLVLFWMGIVR